EWQRVHRCALADARHAVSLETGEQLLSVILGTLFVATCIFTIGSSTTFFTRTASKIVLALLAILAAPFILLILLYIWNFVCAPFADRADRDTGTHEGSQVCGRVRHRLGSGLGGSRCGDAGGERKNYQSTGEMVKLEHCWFLSAAGVNG